MKPNHVIIIAAFLLRAAAPGAENLAQDFRNPPPETRPWCYWYFEIRVTNLWWNRLVGDGKLPPGKRTTFTTAQPRIPRDKLLPSGLLGPVTVTSSLTVTPTK